MLIWSNKYIKNSDKEKYVYSVYGIKFDRIGFWSFDNDNSGNVLIFGVDNSSSSHAVNRKNIFLVLGAGQLLVLMEALVHQRKRLALILIKEIVNGKEILKFKADNENVNFPTQFCLESMSNGLSASESKEVSLNGNVHEFSVDYNSIDKSDIHKYLMTKNNIK